MFGRWLAYCRDSAVDIIRRMLFEGEALQIGLFEARPALSSPHRIDAFQHYWLSFDNTHTVAIHSAENA